MAKTIRVGAAWRKATRDGNEFISISITNPVGPDFQFTLWPVKEKRGDRSPDYDVTKQIESADTYTPRATGQGAPPPDDDVPF